MTFKKLKQITELISKNKPASNYVEKHPIKSIFMVTLLGFLAAVLSGGIVKIILNLISFILKVSAFVYVTKQGFDRVFGIFKKKKPR